MYCDLDWERWEQEWERRLKRYRKRQNAAFASGLLAWGLYFGGAFADWSWFVQMLFVLVYCIALWVVATGKP